MRAAATGPLADRLRLARWQRRWTQATLARRSGLSPNELMRLETGRTVSPRLGTVARLASALGIRAGWLAYGDGDPWGLGTPAAMIEAPPTQVPPAESIVLVSFDRG